ncbi:MAG: hypothetical protein IPK13_28085 [Deltaproteobacteria bacterium]|nr:hypothetical protein [Deltaproteobacteria bacterium]
MMSSPSAPHNGARSVRCSGCSGSVALLLLALAGSGCPRGDPSTTTPQEASAASVMPESARSPEPLAEAVPGLPASVRSDCWLTPMPDLGYPENPCALEADLDGDGKTDRVHLVAETSAPNRRGFVVLFGSGEVAVAGAGRAIGHGGDNLAWMNAWKVSQRRRGTRGSCLLVEQTEAASADICWDGQSLRWHQAGD